VHHDLSQPLDWSTPADNKQQRRDAHDVAKVMREAYPRIGLEATRKALHSTSLLLVITSRPLHANAQISFPKRH
jgi:hypothetical protein